MSGHHSKPQKHHFVPAFYTKRWAGADGLICQFSKPFGNVVVPKRVHPKATGFRHRLYSLRGYLPHEAEQIEERFFKPADTLADVALGRLEALGPKGLSSELRSAWTRFMLSMMLRAPAEIDHFRTLWKGYFCEVDEETERRYAEEIRGPNDPATLREYMETLPEAEVERNLFQVYVRLIDQLDIGRVVNNMIWSVCHTEMAAFELLTSDRPVVRLPLKEKLGFWAMPIGPRRLFVAANSPETLSFIQNLDLSELVVRINTDVVAAAETYVFGSNDWRLTFVQRLMGKAIAPPLLRLRPKEVAAL